MLSGDNRTLLCSMALGGFALAWFAGGHAATPLQPEWLAFVKALVRLLIG